MCTKKNKNRYSEKHAVEKLDGQTLRFRPHIAVFGSLLKEDQKFYVISNESI
jgi:hypothetical protein